MNRKIRIVASMVLLLVSMLMFSSAFGGVKVGTMSGSSAESRDAASTPPSDPMVSNRGLRLMSSFTVFLLAVFVGFEVITKFLQHYTPLMSVRMQLVVLLSSEHYLRRKYQRVWVPCWGCWPLLAFINVVGGFMVTHRMLMMFKKQ